MTIRELREKLNQLSPEMDNYEVVFGESAWGEALKRIQILGRKLFLSFF